MEEKNRSFTIKAFYLRFLYAPVIFICFVLFYTRSKHRFPLLKSTKSKPLLFPEPKSIIHKLCSTQDGRDLVNLSFKQNDLDATASILAASSQVTIQTPSIILDEIDLLIMWERQGRAMPSYQYFTQCFLDWELKVSIQCEIIGFGSVQGQLTLSRFYSLKKEGRLLCPVHTLRIPIHILLRLRLIDKQNELNGTIELCLLNPNRKVHRIVGCSQPLYRVDRLEEKWPGLIRMWIQYYVRYLGFGFVTIYDIDGSTEPYLQGLIEHGLVKYYRSWAPTESMYNLSLNGAPYCSETMMENQCLWQNRGISEWVMLIHAPDNYLNDDFRAPTFYNFLRNVKNRIALILIATLIFGQPNITISKQNQSINLFETIHTRQCQPMTNHRHLPVVNPRAVMMLFVHGAVKPFEGIPTIFNGCPVFVNHYVTMFKSRSNNEYLPIATEYCEDIALSNKTRLYQHLFI